MYISIVALHTSCNDDSECIEGAHCVQRNNTMSGKRCYCQEGYNEEGVLFCNGMSSRSWFLNLLIESSLKQNFL